MKNGEKFHFTELLPVFYVQLQRVIPFTFAGKIYSRSIASINFLHLHSKRSRLASVRNRAVIGVAIQLLLHLRFRLRDDLRILIHIDRCACHCLCRVDQSLVCQSALTLGNDLPGVARCSSRPCSNVGLGSRTVPAHITDVRGTEGHDSVRVERSDKAVHALALMGKDFRLSCFVLAVLCDLL